MLVKYQIPGKSVMLSEFSDIEHVECRHILLTPLGDNIYPIIVKKVSTFDYANIIDELYRTGSVDITNYKDNTQFYDDDQEDGEYICILK